MHADRRERGRAGRAILLLALLPLGGCRDSLVALDRGLLLAVNGAFELAALDALAMMTSDYTAVLLAAVSVPLLVRRRSWRGRVVLAAVFAVAVGLTDWSANVWKQAVGRVRPCGAIPSTRIVSHCPDSPSFPSNHAANAFTVAAVAASTSRLASVPALAAAATISWSRVHLGVHYPFDVAAGGLYGAMVGLLLAFASRRVAGLREIASHESRPPPTTGQ